jgi:hypothetical protein
MKSLFLDKSHIEVVVHRTAAYAAGTHHTRDQSAAAVSHLLSSFLLHRWMT